MGRLKDLELENVELKKKIEFLESWLNGDAKPAVTATKDPELKKKLKQMREELAVARAAMKVQEDELAQKTAFVEKSKALLAEVNDKMVYVNNCLDAMGAEVKDLRQKNADLGQKLKESEDQLRKKSFEHIESEALKKAASEIQELKNETGYLTHALERAKEDLSSVENSGPANKGMWHYITLDDTQKMPKPGQRCLCLCANLRQFVEDIGNRKNIKTLRTPMTDVVFRGGHLWNKADIPDGHVVVAWRPLPVPKGSNRVLEFMFDQVAFLRTQPKLFAELLCDTKRGMMSKAEETKYICDLMKRLNSAFEKRERRIASDVECISKALIRSESSTAGA